MIEKGDEGSGKEGCGEVFIVEFLASKSEPEPEPEPKQANSVCISLQVGMCNLGLAWPKLHPNFSQE